MNSNFPFKTEPFGHGSFSIFWLVIAILLIILAVILFLLRKEKRAVEPIAPIIKPATKPNVSVNEYEAEIKKALNEALDGVITHREMYVRFSDTLRRFLSTKYGKDFSTMAITELSTYASPKEIVQLKACYDGEFREDISDMSNNDAKKTAEKIIEIVTNRG
ncbi:MAG: hypothetical protein K5773_03200 [Pseudobutyrivibrio sp.]|nr:hypothetical protein [Pseudobutyrivibrio sp.]